MTKRRWTKAEIADYRKTHGTFYYNKEDANVLVPKVYGFGFTLNWANPLAWIYLAVLIGFVVYKLS